MSLLAGQHMVATIGLILAVSGLMTRSQAQSAPSHDTATEVTYPSRQASRVQSLQREAQAGQAKAQAKLGDLLFSNGDYTNAVRYYYQAAKQGLPEAQVSLATCYAKGLGVPENHDLARKWARLSLIQSQPPKNQSPGPDATGSETEVKAAVHQSVNLPNQSTQAIRQVAEKTEATDSRHLAGAGKSLPPASSLPETRPRSKPQSTGGHRRILSLEAPSLQLQELPSKPSSYHQ